MVAVTCAVVSLALCAYTYVGYPVLIAVLARLWPQRTAEDRSWRPKVTACVAVHNGREHVEAKLDTLLAQDYPADALEILVCSDGSDDGTDELVAARAAADPRIRLLRSDQRLGKPNALNLMRHAATGEVLLMTDVRQALSPGAVKTLVARLAPAEVGCVSGTLALEGDQGAGVYWRYELAIRRWEARFRSLVGVTGALYAVRRGDVDTLPLDTVLDDMWIPMKLRLAGRRILLADDAVAIDRAADDGREFGRKARTLYGNFQLLARLPRLLVPGLNPSWLETMSHKVARLLCPWALLVLLAASAAGAAGVGEASEEARLAMAALLGGQVIFYLAALAGRRAGKLAGVARTFVVLNAAAVVGLWRFVRGGQRITW